MRTNREKPNDDPAWCVCVCVCVCVCLCLCLWKQAHYLYQLCEAGIKKNIQMRQEWVIDDHNCDYKA